MINYILNRPSRKELMAQIDDLQTTVANLEVERNGLRKQKLNLEIEDGKKQDRLTRVEEALMQEVNNSKHLCARLDSLRDSTSKLLESLGSKDKLIAKQDQLIETQKNEFEFLQKNLNDTICHLRTKLDEKINAVKALTSALDKKILATEPAKRKYVRKEAKK